MSLMESIFGRSAETTSLIDRLRERAEAAEREVTRLQAEVNSARNGAAADRVASQRRFDHLLESNPWYQAFRDIDPGLLEKIAKNRERVPLTFRMVAVAFMADPSDGMALVALKDFITGEMSVPAEAVVSGKKVLADTQMRQAEWRRLAGGHVANCFTNFGRKTRSLADVFCPLCGKPAVVESEEEWGDDDQD